MTKKPTKTAAGVCSNLFRFTLAIKVDSVSPMSLGAKGLYARAVSSSWWWITAWDGTQSDWAPLLNCPKASGSDTLLALNQRSVKLCTYSFLSHWINAERRILSRARGDEKVTPLDKISCSRAVCFNHNPLHGSSSQGFLVWAIFTYFCRNTPPHSGGHLRLPLGGTRKKDEDA